jgi:hypothetical protein
LNFFEKKRKKRVKKRKLIDFFEQKNDKKQKILFGKVAALWKIFTKIG